MLRLLLKGYKVCPSTYSRERSHAGKGRGGNCVQTSGNSEYFEDGITFRSKLSVVVNDGDAGIWCNLGKNVFVSIPLVIFLGSLWRRSADQVL